MIEEKNHRPCAEGSLETVRKFDSFRPCKSLSYEWLYPGGDKRKSLIGSDFRFGLSAAVGDI